MSVVERDVLARGVRLRVSDSGSGPSVLLLHGLFLDRRTWDGVRRALPRQLRIVTPDLPGFGESEKPSPGRFGYDVEAFTEAVLDLYAGLELGRAHVVGQCLGGAVALALAARHPELVERLVLVDALVDSPRLGFWGRGALLPMVGAFAFRQLWTRAVFGAFFKDRLLSEDASSAAAALDGYYEAFSEPRARASALETLRATLDTRGVLAQTLRLRAKTLVVWGDQDRMLPVRVGRKLSRDIPGARFELIAAGHAPQEERPEELARLLEGFLR